jgi:hypothetical protein
VSYDQVKKKKIKPENIPSLMPASDKQWRLSQQDAVFSEPPYKLAKFGIFSEQDMNISHNKEIRFQEQIIIFAVQLQLTLVNMASTASVSSAEEQNECIKQVEEILQQAATQMKRKFSAIDDEAPQNARNGQVETNGKNGRNVSF